MNHRPGFSTKGIRITQVLVLLPVCLVLVAILFRTPHVAAKVPVTQNRDFTFHGHHVRVALASDLVNKNSPPGVSGLAGLVPIPGGIDLPPVIHVFVPGPAEDGLMGLDVEPNVISNFQGFVAQAYPVGLGTAQDADGKVYDVNNDMRVFQGEYVSSDGTHHRGTFVLI